MESHRLSQYRTLRNFDRTPEPEGCEQKCPSASLFVLQEHDASTLHYDLRIEVDGVLVSWAIPKGLSLDPRQKRLAIRTEDYPIEYAEFEGVIPDGEFGAGAVIVWDSGTYRPLSESPVSESLAAGRVDIWLEGEKIRGGFALIHACLGGSENNWLVNKLQDECADKRRNPAHNEPRSVISGRTIEDIVAPRA